MRTPKVTIGIPTFNRAAYLREAIQSVLTQTHGNLEVIVSDNASTDDTGAVLASQTDRRLMVIRHAENRGMVANWNTCLNRATGEFFLLLSDDDILEPDAIERLLGGFVSTNVVFSYGPVRNIQESGVGAATKVLVAPALESGQQFFANVFKGRRAVFPSATLYHAAVAKAVGGFPGIGTTADMGLLLQLALRGEVAFTPDPVVSYRVHADAESFSRRAIASQVKFVEWTNTADPLLKPHRTQVIRYSTMMVYGWGRYHAVRGHKSESAYARSVLRQMPRRSIFVYMLILLELPGVTRLARMRRGLIKLLRPTIDERS